MLSLVSRIKHEGKLETVRHVAELSSIPTRYNPLVSLVNSKML